MKFLVFLLLVGSISVARTAKVKVHSPNNEEKEFVFYEKEKEPQQIIETGNKDLFCVADFASTSSTVAITCVHNFSKKKSILSSTLADCSSKSTSLLRIDLTESGAKLKTYIFGLVCE
jgi:hypothetical protein